MRFWLCDPGEQPQGPFTVKEIREAVSVGRFSPRVMSCPEGATEWSPVATVLAADVATNAPPPPVALPGPRGHETRSAGDEALGWIVPSTADPMVIAASYLALFGIVVPLLGPVALLLAILAMWRRDRYPSGANLTRIVITMCLGALGTLTTLFVLVGVIGGLRGAGVI